jgi:monofunctional biosynthetic peptidoglycan transglycosylase
MRSLRILLLLLLLPVGLVLVAAVHFPVVVWHRWYEPRATALMKIRESETEGENREWKRQYRWVPLSRVSPHFQRAVVVAEDTRFFEHRGFDLDQLREAWSTSRRRGTAMRGASTITQQTIKNLYLSPSRSVIRKLREALLTAWMELWLPKSRILELYLNVVELGPGVFGAEAAARVYYGRSAADLTAEQAAMLAATLPAPLRRNPGAPTPGLHRRQRMILDRMQRWYSVADGAEVDDDPRAEALDGETMAETEVGDPEGPEQRDPAEPELVPADPIAWPGSEDSMDLDAAEAP